MLHPSSSSRCFPCTGVHELGVLLIGFFVWNASPLHAETPAQRKADFSLFNPTPRDQMRDLSPDRPDATESPITVDAGHVQIELSFFDYSRNKDDGNRQDARTFFDTNIKLGLTNHIDLQFVVAAHTIERTKTAGAISDTSEGLADAMLRLKVNLWGNDEGDPRTPQGLVGTALALMPFITIPTGSDLSSDHLEGGLIIPFAIDLADNIGLGLMAEIDFIYDDEDDGYDIELVHSAVIGFDVVGPLGAYIEYVGILSSDGGTSYIAFLSTGLTFEVSENLLLDLGIRIGLNDDAEDFGIFTGMTVRF